MGINLEYITLLSCIYKKYLINKKSVLEFGAQDISALQNAVSGHLEKLLHISIDMRIDSAKNYILSLDVANTSA